jgi:metal-responsive CopG/Arc/MetJ family transcriptional regulator
MSKQQKRGRPATGRQYGETIPVRLPSALCEALDKSAKRHGVSRSELIRRLLGEAVNVSPQAHMENK